MIKRRQRLNTKEQFQSVYRSGIRVETEWYAVLYRINRLSHSRFATVVRKGFGNAVKRNTAKRRARSLFHLFQAKVSPACDILLFPKKAMLTQKRDVLADHFEQMLKQAHLHKDRA